jgi:FkbM family methyltransferase
MAAYLTHRVVESIDSSIPRPLKRLVKRLFPNLVNGFYQRLSAATSDRTEQVTIKQGLLAGRPFRCCLKYERHYWLGNWEPELQAFAQQYLRLGMVVYDVGVHVGFFSLLAAQLVGPTGRVLGFEPHAPNRTLAGENFALNPDLAQRIELYDSAVSDVTGTEALVGAASMSSTMALARVSDGGQRPRAQVEVASVTLDDFIASGHPGPNFIKMDIEGGERLALRGMRQTLEHHRPTLVVELHDEECWREFIRLTGQVGYTCRRLSEATFAQEPPWTGRDQYLAAPAEEVEAKATAFP